MNNINRIEEEVVGFFREKGLFLATAESCTGGLISKRITDVSGASEMFGYGFCTYANEAKEKILGVKSETLAAHGAVSSETAAEMAAGLAKVSGADVCIAVTGLAGPGGGSKEKPVGLVFLGIYAKSSGVRTVKLLLGEEKSRDEIRGLTADRALSEALFEAGKLCKAKNF